MIPTENLKGFGLKKGTKLEVMDVSAGDGGTIIKTKRHEIKAWTLLMPVLKQ